MFETTKLLRSSPFKVAAAFAIAVVVTTLGVFAFVSWEVTAADTAQVRAVLQYEAATAVTMPPDQVKGELEARLTHDLRRLDYVGLFNSNGVLTYGNAPKTIPVPVDGQPHSTAVTTGAPRTTQPAIFVAQRRPDGTTLLLGRSLLEVYHLEATLRLAFFAAIIPTVLIALVTGAIASRAAAKRLSLIQDAIRRVMRGELDARLPTRESSDDINELASAVNLMLDEIVRLLNQIKSVGDNIAHDLKTPLALMRARLERGLEENSFECLTKTTHEALNELDKAMTTVTALLRISALESGLQRRAFAYVDLADICRDVFDLFEPLASAKSIAMTLESPRSRIVYGDGDLLREAVANLVDNAVKYTPAEGAIVLQIDRGGALIRVADTGPGIAPDEREKIFKRFYRAKDASGVPGVGLGLSMAATIVALHGYVLRIGDGGPGAVFELVPSASASGPT